MKRITYIALITFVITSFSQFELIAQQGGKSVKASSESRRTLSAYGHFDFSLHTIDGKIARLRDHTGKVVLVNIWAPWCGPCRAETPGFVKVYDEFKNKGFEIISIAANTNMQEVKLFVEEYGVRWVVGISDDIAARYGTTGIPDNYLFGPDGK